MKKLAVIMLAVSMTVCAAASERRGATLDRVRTSSTVLSQIMSAPDSAIPDAIMSGAKCIAIVPSNLKASFIFGANYGKGVATCRTATGWSAPVFFKMTGGSFGFQAGGQASDLVLIIRTDEGMQHLLQSRFKLGGDASAAAGPVGRDAQASTDLTMRAQILTYSRCRGLFLGVSLGGAVVRQDDADTEAFYGKTWTFYSLLNGEVTATPDSMVLLNTVEKYAPTPKVRAQVSPPPAPAAAPETAAAPATAAATAAPSTAAPVTLAAPPATATPATTAPVTASSPAATAATAKTDAEAETADPMPDTAPAAAPAPATPTPAVAPNNGDGHR
jgi:lipid-binding SYLF domain-containing protein